MSASLGLRLLSLTGCAFAGIVPLRAAAVPTWEAFPNAPVSGSRHEDVFFTDPTHGWLVNIDGSIWATPDGGDSWVLQRETGAQNRSIGFANPLRGWVGTLSGRRLFETTNGGENWPRVMDLPVGDPPGICGISVASEQVVYGVGAYYGGAGILKTTDGGASWSAISMAPWATTLIDVRFTSPDVGIVVGGIGEWPDSTRARVLSTTDGGANWTVRHTGSRAGEWCWKISFPTPSVGYVSLERIGGLGFLLKTTDGGATWSELEFVAANEQGIGFATETLGWIGGAANPTYVTTDGGATWQVDGFGANVNRFRMVSETFGYAVGQTVYRYSDPLAVEAGTTRVAGAFELLPGTPNPFASATVLRFSLARDAFARLSVVDVAGRRVRLLTEGRRAAGEHRIAWDGLDQVGRPVASGVYYSVLDVQGRRQTGRVVRVR